MTYPLNETHDPQRTSWVESANVPGCDFPIQNLPFGVFRRRGRDEAPRAGIAIGASILDLPVCLGAGLLQGQAAQAAERCVEPALNPLMALGRPYWSELRRQVAALLSAEDPAGLRGSPQAERLLVPIDATELLLPAAIGDYTDFYASVHHATNVGSMFRPDNPLLLNYKHVPIGYHGRASSIVVSGTSVRRPTGQTRDDQAERPDFGPSRLLDYEAEVGFLIGPGNRLGEPIPIDEAEEHLFGVCLVNDWSARDIQRWEYQPLGPFLSKSFATSVSPWVVTIEALAPFRIPAPRRPAGDPAPLPYLLARGDQERGGIDLAVEVYLRSPQMRDHGLAPVRFSRGTLADMYWTAAQLLAHHASNGCNLRPGDLLASGTVSGAAKEFARVSAGADVAGRGTDRTAHRRATPVPPGWR